MGRVLTILVVAMVVAAGGAAQSSDPWVGSMAVGLGPLILRSQSPLNLLRLSPTPITPVTVPAGEWVASLMTGWNNYFDYDPTRYLIDAETVRLAFGGIYGVSSRTDLSIEVPLAYRGGGVMDGFIEGFESSLGVSNRERLRFPRNQFLIRIVGPDGVILQRRGAASGWGLEDVVLGLRHQLARGSETSPSIVASVTAKLPWGREDALRSTGGVDYGISLAVGQRLRSRFHLYATAMLMRYAETDLVGIELKRSQVALFAAVEFRKSTRTSYLLQAMTVSPSARDYGGFSRPTYEITAGVKKVLSRDLMLEAAFLENLFVFDNSPDFGVHVGFIWHPHRHP
ncbi:MAG TPA: DUF3187 family protein [Thermoanaerobaculaceae bacterium]|nr:DUF3187 family protein [Thermoanaerobaculaceae bacterium]HPS77929.1 DUF3187 family protein [Thermoanaerobaculaceae bacterium]